MDPLASKAQLYEVPLAFDRETFLERATAARVVHQAQLHKGPVGDWAEFGVAEGWSARVLLRLMPDDGSARLWLFDSWEGLPEDMVGRDGVIEKAGKFACDVPWSLQDDARVRMVRGLFADTGWGFPGVDFPPAKGLAVLHVDVDLYSSAVQVLAVCAPYIGSGTVVILDDCHGWPGWDQGGEWKAWHELAEAKGIGFKWISRMERWRAALVVL